MLPTHNHTSTNIPRAVLNAALFHDKLNLCHGNAQSLCARNSTKLDEVRNVLSDSKVEIACFTESWLSSRNSDRSIQIPGFSVVRNDRVYKRGGGIAVYYREHLICSKIFGTVLTTESQDKTECLALEFRIGGQKILLMTIYNPPENDCSSFLAEKLADFAVRYENIFLIGDFNTDMLHPSSKRARFESMLCANSLSYICNEPTFFYNGGCTQLDLLLTNSTEKVLRFGQVSFPGLSQHDFIFASVDFDTSRSSSRRVYRDYTNFDPHTLENALLSIPWNRFYQIENPNEAIEFFNEHVKRVHDSCIPLRDGTSRRRHNPWFTDVVRQALLERDLAYKDWLQAPPHVRDVKRQRYKVLRNRATMKVAQAKQQYLNQFLDSRVPSKILWQRVRSLGVGKDKSSKPCEFDPDVVNRAFLANYTSNTQQTSRPPSSTPPSPYSFSFQPVQHWEVVNAIWDIQSSAVGMDELPNNFIKIILPLVVHHITHLFNMFIRTSTFPDCWKHAKILPLKKKPHLNDVNNLRPISILCALSKAFEKLLKRQMTSYIESNNLLSDHQAGFRGGQSVKTAVLRVHDDLGATIDKKGVGILLLLDFSKAFDTIVHRKLLNKLEVQFNFSPSSVNLLGSYLCGRKQTVFCDNRFSSCADVSSGVPQGSVLGPLLFCCHINDLPTVLKYCSIQIYADDVQLYVRRLGPCTSELIRMINADLQHVADWSRRNSLQVNPAKSKAIYISSQRRLNSGFPDARVVLDGQSIEWTESANNLGFIFQNNLQWDSLIAQQCGKIYASLRTLYNCAPTAPTATKLKLFKSLILPHFLFGDVLHVYPSASSFDRLRVALNCCVRYVYGLSRYDHVSHLQKNLIGCSLRGFYAYRSCIFLRNLLTTQTPASLYQKIVQTRGRRLQNLVIPANNTASYSSSLFVRGVVNWNTLPPALKRSSSEANFKSGCINFWNRDS